MSRRYDWNGTDCLRQGEYAQHPTTGDWYYAIPGTPPDLVGRLGEHKITEHEDGTITVFPSLLLTTDDGREWHGWLNQGVWSKYPVLPPRRRFTRRMRRSAWRSFKRLTGRVFIASFVAICLIEGFGDGAVSRWVHELMKSHG